MVEMRWVWHDLKNGSPPSGSLRAGERLYQRLQYRQRLPHLDHSGRVTPLSDRWTDWIYVPLAGFAEECKSD